MAEAKSLRGKTRTKSLSDINNQAVRISQLARQTGDYDRFGNALNIATNYRANIRNTPEYQAGGWVNNQGVNIHSGSIIQFPMSVYARRNNRRG